MSKNDSIPPFDLSPEIEKYWDEINDAIQRVLRHGQFIMGEETRLFEEKAAEYLGAEYAVGVNSGTDALVISLRAAGIEPGDEVITTPFSFFATAESISMVGAKPVFVDIEEDSFNIDPDKVEAALNEKTKAILPVHLYGNPCSMTQLLEIADQHGLKVIEDCAQSFGATYSDSSSRLDGRQTGSMGDAGAFSFFPTKNLGGYGDGGLVITDDPAIAETTDKLRRHGSLKKYHNEMLGYNSRLDTIQAAILLVKLKLIDTYNLNRRQAAEIYERNLEGISQVKPPEPVAGHVFHQYTVRITDGRRDELRSFLKEQGIGSMVYYPIPQDKLPVYKGQYPDLPVSNKLSEQVISLPIWPQIEEEKIERVCAVIEEFFD